MGRGQLCNSVVEHLPGMHKVLDKDKRKKIYWPFYGDMAWFPLVQKLLCLLIAPLPPIQQSQREAASSSLYPFLVFSTPVLAENTAANIL